MTDLSPASDHASHDTILVSSLADHSLPVTERAAAEALVASCTQCADLQADLLALRAATRAMPTPARPNDYTLTESDAARLRSGGWRRFVTILGTSRDALSRPLAIGLTTLGLAGLLVTAAPALMIGGASSAAAPTVAAPAGDAAAATDDESTKLGAVAVPQASAAAAARSAAPAPGGISGSAVGQSAAPAAVPPQAAIADGATQQPGTEAYTNGTERAQAGTTGGKSQEPEGTSDLLAAQEIGGVSPLPVLSVAFLVAALALFALRWTARRIGA